MGSSLTITSLHTAQTLKTKKLSGRSSRHCYNTNNVPYLVQSFCHFFLNEQWNCLQLSHVNSATHFYQRRKGEKKMHLPFFLFCLSFLTFFFYRWVLKLTDTSRQCLDSKLMVSCSLFLGDCSEVLGAGMFFAVS